MTDSISSAMNTFSAKCAEAHAEVGSFDAFLLIEDFIKSCAFIHDN